MSELCLGVSGWGLRVSGDELIRNILVHIFIGHVSSDIAFYSSACQYVKTPMSGRCLDGVCGCLDHIWGCLADVWGSIDVTKIINS